MKDPEINPQNSGHLIFDKGAKAIHWGGGKGCEVSIFHICFWKKKENQSILISLYKAEVQVDRGPPQKNTYTETNGKESREDPISHEHEGNFSD